MSGAIITKERARSRIVATVTLLTRRDFFRRSATGDQGQYESFYNRIRGCDLSYWRPSSLVIGDQHEDGFGNGDGLSDRISGYLLHRDARTGKGWTHHAPGVLLPVIY